MKDYIKSSDTRVSQAQAKNAVRQNCRIIPHRKCQETLQCQEQKSMYTAFTMMMSVGLVLVCFRGFYNHPKQEKKIIKN